MAEGSSTAAPPSHYEEPYRYGEEERRSSFTAEDERWRVQWRDWLVLALMIIVSLGYHFTIFALQPGLR